MATYLTFNGKGCECAGCGREIRKALVAWTDEIDPHKLEPVCRNCSQGLAPKLRAVQDIVSGAGQRTLEEIENMGR